MTKKKFLVVLAAVCLSAGGDDGGYAFGSGIFGSWITDEAGLPAYLYTMRHDDPRAAWDPKVYPVNSLHWHQVGNDRVTANAYNLGMVELFYGESGAYWLNRYRPAKNAHSGGFGWLLDGATVMLDRDDEIPSGVLWERVFGMGYFRKRLDSGDLALERRVMAPAGWGEPALYSEVTIHNRSEREKELAYIEYWDANVEIVDDFLLAGGLASRFRDDQMSASVEGGVLWVKPGERQADPARPRLVYPALPSLFLDSLNTEPAAWITDPDDLFADGRPKKDAKSLARAGALSPLPGLRSQDKLCLAARYRLSIPAGGAVSLVFKYGYKPANGIEPAPPPPGGLAAPSGDNPMDGHLERWRKSAPSLDLPSLPWLGRELGWDYYYLNSSAVYDGYYRKYHVPQGGNYLYYSGGNGATRDYAAFVIALAYYRPELAREILGFMMRSQETDGRLFYDLEGHGKRYTVPYRPGDLDLWFLWALCEYVFVTRDFEFLDEIEPYYPLAREDSGPAWEHAARSFRHLVDVVGTGRHGHPRLRLSDWNDEMMWLTAGHDPAEMLATYMRGESVMNTAMAVYILPMFEDLCRARGETELGEEVAVYVNGMRSALDNAWSRDHLIRSYSGFGEPYGEDIIFLEPLAWALLAEALPADRTETAIQTMADRLGEPSALGMMISSSASGSLTTRAGEQEEGGIWFAINGPAAVGLSNYDANLGFEEILKNSLAWHAHAYPELWYGIWSGPDAWNSVVSERPGETWYMKSAVMNTGPQMYPIQNAHSHCQTMWALARMAGLTPKADGWRVEALIPAERYSLTTTVFEMNVEKDSIRVWPRLGQPMVLRVGLRKDWDTGSLRVVVGGEERPVALENGDVRVDLVPASNGHLPWVSVDVE